MSQAPSPAQPLTADGVVHVLGEVSASLSGSLHSLVAQVVTAAALGEGAQCAAGRDELLSWAERALLPHVHASATVLLPTLQEHHDGAALLVEALTDDADRLGDVVLALRESPTAVHAAAHAMSLQVATDRYLGHENTFVLSALRDRLGAEDGGDQGADGATALLARYYTALAGFEPRTGGCGGDCGACGCGGQGAGDDATADRLTDHQLTDDRVTDDQLTADQGGSGR